MDAVNLHSFPNASSMPFSPMVMERNVSSAPEALIKLGSHYEVSSTAVVPVAGAILVLVEGQPVIITTGKPLADAGEAKTASPRIAVQDLDFIREKLSLSVTQISELFGVTRKSVYDWFEGASPRPTMMEKISVLTTVLSEMPSTTDLSRLKAVWKLGGATPSFLSIIGDDTLDANSLRVALAEKLDELAPRLVPTSRAVPSRNAIDFRSADAERHTDFG